MDARKRKRNELNDSKKRRKIMNSFDITINSTFCCEKRNDPTLPDKFEEYDHAYTLDELQEEMRMMNDDTDFIYPIFCFEGQKHREFLSCSYNNLCQRLKNRSESRFMHERILDNVPIRCALDIDYKVTGDLVSGETFYKFCKDLRWYISEKILHYCRMSKLNIDPLSQEDWIVLDASDPREKFSVHMVLSSVYFTSSIMLRDFLAYILCSLCHSTPKNLEYMKPIFRLNVVDFAIYNKGHTLKCYQCVSRDNRSNPMRRMCERNEDGSSRPFDDTRFFKSLIHHRPPGPFLCIDFKSSLDNLNQFKQIIATGTYQKRSKPLFSSFEKINYRRVRMPNGNLRKQLKNYLTELCTIQSDWVRNNHDGNMITWTPYNAQFNYDKDNPMLKIYINNYYCAIKKSKHDHRGRVLEFKMKYGRVHQSCFHTNCKKPFGWNIDKITQIRLNELYEFIFKHTS
jgi:hypothetical protein